MVTLGCRRQEILSDLLKDSEIFSSVQSFKGRRYLFILSAINKSSNIVAEKYELLLQQTFIDCELNQHS
jgi:hypothetical protein